MQENWVIELHGLQVEGLFACEDIYMLCYMMD